MRCSRSLAGRYSQLLFELPPGLSEFFCLEGVLASVLFRSLNLPLPPESVGDRVAIRVCCMGWSWAHYLAQIASEAAIASVRSLFFQTDGDDEDSEIGFDEEPSRCDVAPPDAFALSGATNFFVTGKRHPSFLIN